MQETKIKGYEFEQQIILNQHSYRSQNIHKIQTYHTFTRLIMDIDFDLGD